MRYQQQEFIDSYSYTNYNVSVEEIGKIKEVSINELPEFLDVNGVQVRVYQVGSFVPPQAIYDADGGDCDWVKKDGWFVHSPTGLKVREEKNQSPEFQKSHGTRTTKLIAKIPYVKNQY